MKLIKKAAGAIKQVFTGKNEKLEILLDAIDSITVDPNTNMVHIKTSRNIAVENDGHMVVINKGHQVLMSKAIHLNPSINFDDKNMDELEPRLEEAIQKEIEYQYGSGCDHEH